MNYYVVFAAKRHYDLMKYMGDWLEKAFKLFQWYGDELENVQSSFIRKQKRVISRLLDDNASFDFGLHYLGGGSGSQELCDALWPNVCVDVEELEDLEGVIDATILEGAFPEQFGNKIRCAYKECTICDDSEWKMMCPEESSQVTCSIKKWNAIQDSVMLNKKATSMDPCTGMATECRFLNCGDPFFRFICHDGKRLWVHEVELLEETD